MLGHMARLSVCCKLYRLFHDFHMKFCIRNRPICQTDVCAELPKSIRWPSKTRSLYFCEFSNWKNKNESKVYFSHPRCVNQIYFIQKLAVCTLVYEQYSIGETMSAIILPTESLALNDYGSRLAI